MERIRRVEAWVERRLEEMTAEDDPALLELARQEFGVMPWLTGFYLDLSTPRKRRLAAAFLLYLFLNGLFHGFVMLVTVQKAFVWHVDISLQILNYLCAGILTCVINFNYIRHRRTISRQFKFLTHTFPYDLEVGVDAPNKFSRLRGRALRYIAVGCPLMFFLSLLGFVAFRVPLQQRYLNGIDLSLPIILWYPFPVDSWPVYLLVALGQLLTALQLIGALSFGLYLFFNAATRLLIEQQRLNDSVYCIERRALHMLRKSLGETDLNEIKSEYDLYRNKDFESCFLSCLKENINHHRMIKKTFEDVNELIREPLALGVVIYMVAMGGGASAFILKGYLCSKVSASIVFTMSCVTATIMCMIGQESTNVAKELPEAVYSTKWYLMNKPMARNISILLSGTRLPTSTSAIAYDFRTLYMIFRGTYSFYSFFMLTQGNIRHWRRRR